MAVPRTAGIGASRPLPCVRQRSAHPTDSGRSALLDAIDAAKDAREAGGEAQVWDQSTAARVYDPDGWLICRTVAVIGAMDDRPPPAIRWRPSSAPVSYRT